MLRKLMLALVLAQSVATVAVAQVEDREEPRTQAGTPTFHFIGDRYRIGIGLDSEFDVVGEFQAALYESQRSSFIGDGWLGSQGAGGVKLNYHWLVKATAEEGPDGPVYTDGSVAKLFVAADQNQLDDRKLTFGAGWEGRNWAFSGYGMTALSDERLVNRTQTIEDMLVTGQIDGRAFSRVDTIETVTEWFEEPYDWGLGLRAERFFDNPLIRLRGGLDYEEGDFSSSQITASLSLDKHFHNSPHSLSFRTSYAHKDGDFVIDDSDLRGSVVYSFSFGGAESSFRPSRRYRDMEVQVAGEPRTVERVTVNEVTLTDRTTFDFDSSVLKPAAENTLDEVLAVIEDGGLVGDIQIVGHTCNIGTEEYNQGLSERRARSVVDYLTSRGVEADRIDWRGEGETVPRFPNDSPENRAKNRRVEISFATERTSTETVTVGPDEPATEIRQVEVPVEAPWIRRALRNPVRHKRIVDYYRYQESTASVTEGEIEFANEAPQAGDDQYTVDADSVDNAFDVLANDSDADGDPLTIVSVSAPANGQVSISGDQVLYTPNAGFTGTDSFSYTVDDGFGGQASATVTVTVQSLNQPPVVNDLTATTLRNQPVDIDVLAAASDPDGDELVIAGFTQPDNGSVSQSGDVLRYMPDHEFFGSDSFTYTISDGRGGEASATVLIEVAFANRAPVANPDQATVPAGQAVTVDVLANDYDPDGDPLEVIEVSQWYGMPAEYTINGDGTITFRVSDSCNGRNRFSYTITDPWGATATANVEVTRIDGGGASTSQSAVDCGNW